MGLLLPRFGELWDWIWIPREVARESRMISFLAFRFDLARHSSMMSPAVPG
jgi:hypothetical protein